MTIMDNTHIMFIGIMASFLHEIGHVLAMLYEKKDIKEIKVGLFNIDILDDSRSRYDYRTDLTILFSGPLMNIVVYFLCVSINIVARSYIMEVMGYENLFIGLINLLPIMPLDGGQILFVILSKRVCGETCERVTQIVSFLTLLPLALVGFIILLESKYNFSLLFLCFYLMTYLLFKNDPFY